MAVYNETRKAGPYTTDGQQTAFTFAFKVFKTTQIEVRLSETEETESVVPPDLYTVMLNTDQDNSPGGTVTFATAPVADKTLTILSAVEYTQELILTNRGGFYPQQINDQNDKAAILAQQLKEIVDRTLKVPSTSNETQEQMIKRLFIARDDAEKAADEARKASDVAKGVEEKVKEYSWDVPHLVNSVEDVERYPHDGYFWVKGFGNPGQAGSDISNRLVNVAGGQRTLGSKLSDIVSVKDFGAKGDGVTDDTAAFLRMADTLNEILVPRGDFVVTGYIDVPIEFLNGAAVLIPNGKKLTFRNRITASPKQQIFKGEGDVCFELNVNYGEDSKHSYASWWGIFPFDKSTIVNDLAPAINKALSAYTSQLREGIFELDVGSYPIASSIVIPRGVHLKGAGTRRTIFDLLGNGFEPIVTGGVAVKITGIQFEQVSGTEQYFDGVQIHCKHDTPTVEDVIFWNAKIGVQLDSDCNIATVKHIRGVYGREPEGGYGEDTALVACSGTNVLVDDVGVMATTFSPRSIVNVGLGATKTTRGIIVSNVRAGVNCIAVQVNSATAAVSDITVHGVNYWGTKTLQTGIVHLNNPGNFDISGVSVCSVTSNGKASAYLSIDSGGALTGGVTLSGCSSYGEDTKAIIGDINAGTVQDIFVGSSVASLNLKPIDIKNENGTLKNIKVPDHLIGKLRLAPNTADKIYLPKKGGQLVITCEGNDPERFTAIPFSGVVLFDAGVSPFISLVSGGTRFEVNASYAPLNGNTGTPEKTTVTVTDGYLWVEHKGAREATYSFSIQ